MSEVRVFKVEVVTEGGGMWFGTVVPEVDYRIVEKALGAKEAELAAYKKAKAENDERFQLERDEALALVKSLKELLRRAETDNEVLHARLTATETELDDLEEFIMDSLDNE